MVEFIPPQPEPTDPPAPLAPDVPFTPPLVGKRSPFFHVDGQNRDEILEGIRVWASQNLLGWSAEWQEYLINRFIAHEAWLGQWDAATVAYVTASVDEIIGNSVVVQDPVMAGIITNEASLAVAALIQRFGAPAISNPETEVHDAIKGVVADELGGGAANFVQYVDARGDLNKPRPATLGQVVWYINMGAVNPTHVIAGDVVSEVTVEEIPWTPALVPEKIMWLDAQSLALANNTPVANWPDKSGRNNHAVQATPAKQPLLVLNKTNGHPAVVADGVDDRLTTVLDQAYTGGSFTLYLFAGTTLADATGAQFLVAGAKTGETAGTQLNLYRDSEEKFIMRRNQSLLSDAGLWSLGPKKIRLVFDGLNSSLRVNGVNLAVGQTAISSMVLQTLSIFAQNNDAQWANMWLGELLLIRGTVTDAVDQRIVSYWDNRWY